MEVDKRGEKSILLSTWTYCRIERKASGLWLDRKIPFSLVISIGETDWHYKCASEGRFFIHSHGKDKGGVDSKSSNEASNDASGKKLFLATWISHSIFSMIGVRSRKIWFGIWFNGKLTWNLHKCLLEIMRIIRCLFQTTFRTTPITRCR